MTWRNPGRDPASFDTIIELLGADTADNTMASTLVASNADGSIYERLEYLQAQLAILQSTNVTSAVYNPLLGFGVTKVHDLATVGGTDALFTVTGRCLVTSLTGEVTTVVGGAATLKLTDTTNSVDLCAATTIDTDAVGTMYALPGLTAQILNGTGGTPVVGSVPNMTIPSGLARLIVGDAQAALSIGGVLDAADTGAITWRLFYFPLVSGATITAAA